MLLLGLSVVGLAQAQENGTSGRVAPAGTPVGEATESVAASNGPDVSQPFVVATREAPPFAMKDGNGEWTGLSIWLWERIAADLDIEYQLEETDLASMIEGVADGRYESSIAAMTITPSREQLVDFSHPFYSTGFGIAVERGGGSWISSLAAIFTWGFIQAVLALAALLAGIGVLFWLAERRANPDEFGGNPIKGIGSGFWFSAVTMTTVGYGDKAPRTIAGRVIALIWMFGAILIISTFTGMIASALTTNRLATTVEGPDDLAGVSVGSIGGSSSDEWLGNSRVSFMGYESVQSGLTALARGRMDAFVYDKPLLQYRIKNEFADDLEVLPGAYGRQDYGIALPQGSDLREPVNQALLNVIESEEWADRVFAALGALE
ncbi:extracellular solute-binding protein, family 3 [Fulvimarina pelagi HTCC2506]|uniref:Extracellular solute-binding protein, family 3 n=1 Tax=Fulvimarina pelagi HTCC2506 TaxID=314231 RepID=Q0G788_9HYPH|nr:transporter substrate-binding domain-containing protein [Fulvimarina pelagi]EAU42476.1 extracellular solute-binding protein, family 3 [Fulvimarina pelagi HTCC2506]